MKPPDGDDFPKSLMNATVVLAYAVFFMDEIEMPKPVMTVSYLNQGSSWAFANW